MDLDWIHNFCDGGAYVTTLRLAHHDLSLQRSYVASGLASTPFDDAPTPCDDAPL